MMISYNVLLIRVRLNSIMGERFISVIQDPKMNIAFLDANDMMILYHMLHQD